MDQHQLNSLLQGKSESFISVYESRPNEYKVLVPIYHEDGDMIEVFIELHPELENHVRIFDHGLSLQRLSYSYDVNTKSKIRILDSILWNNDLNNDSGIFYLDSSLEGLFDNLLKFIGGVQKICNMRYWTRDSSQEVVHRFNEASFSLLNQYNVKRRYRPPEYDGKYLVDWYFNHKEINFYLFGVGGKDKAYNTVITLLEYQSFHFKFQSMVVYYNPSAKIPSKLEDSVDSHASRIYRNVDQFCLSVHSDVDQLTTSLVPS